MTGLFSWNFEDVKLGPTSFNPIAEVHYLHILPQDATEVAGYDDIDGSGFGSTNDCIAPRTTSLLSKKTPGDAKTHLERILLPASDL